MPGAPWACCCPFCADCTGASDTATVTLDSVLMAAACQGPCAVGVEPNLGSTMYHWTRVDAGGVDGTYSLSRTVTSPAECRWEGVFDGPTVRVVRDGGDPSFNPAFVDCDTLAGQDDPDNGSYNTFHRRTSTQIKITLSRKDQGAGWKWYVTAESYGSSPAGIPPGPYDGTDPGPIAAGLPYFSASTAGDCATPPAGAANDIGAWDCATPGKGGTATASFP